MLYFSLILGLAHSNITFPEVRETHFRVTWNPLPQQFHIGRLLGYRIYFRRSAIFQYHLIQLWCSFATKFFAMASFKTKQDLIFLSRTSNFIHDEEFLCCLTFSSGKTPAFRTKIIQLSTWMRWPSPSVCQSLDLEKETFWCDSCFPYKVYFLYIKDIWFALPKYVQINLSLTSSLARPPQLLSFSEVKTIH